MPQMVVVTGRNEAVANIGDKIWILEHVAGGHGVICGIYANSSVAMESIAGITWRPISTGPHVYAYAAKAEMAGTYLLTEMELK